MKIYNFSCNIKFYSWNFSYILQLTITCFSFRLLFDFNGRMAKNRFLLSLLFPHEIRIQNVQQTILAFLHDFSSHDTNPGNNTCVYIVSEICILERRICIVSASLFACLWLRSREGKMERTDLDARIKRKEGDIEFDSCDKNIE